MPRSETDTENTQKRQAELERLRRILPESEPWEKWLVESGELPPNFDAMRQIPGLPDPLRFEDGREITDQSDWPARREELLKLFHHYVEPFLQEIQHRPNRRVLFPIWENHFVHKQS